RATAAAYLRAAVANRPVVVARASSKRTATSAIEVTSYRSTHSVVTSLRSDATRRSTLVLPKRRGPRRAVTRWAVTRSMRSVIRASQPWTWSGSSGPWYGNGETSTSTALPYKKPSRSTRFDRGYSLGWAEVGVGGAARSGEAVAAGLEPASAGLAPAVDAGLD